jgi:hypothetical protein
MCLILESFNPEGIICIIVIMIGGGKTFALVDNSVLSASLVHRAVIRSDAAQPRQRKLQG